VNHNYSVCRDERGRPRSITTDSVVIVVVLVTVIIAILVVVLIIVTIYIAIISVIISFVDRFGLGTAVGGVSVGPVVGRGLVGLVCSVLRGRLVVG